MTQMLRINNFCCSCDLEKCRKQRQLSLRLLGEAEETGREPRGGWTPVSKTELSSLEQCQWHSEQIQY